MDNLLPAIEIISTSLIFVVILVGLVGLVIPIFPGTVVMWGAMLVYGIAFGFGRLGLIMFIIISIIMIASTLVDNLLMGVKAHERGASWLAIILGILAGIVGTIFLAPFGGIIAAPCVLFLVEYIRAKDIKEAFDTTKGMLIGWGWAFVARFAMGLVMIALWGVWVFAG